VRHDVPDVFLFIMIDRDFRDLTASSRLSRPYWT
jgi:hypothetical protein